MEENTSIYARRTHIALWSSGKTFGTHFDKTFRKCPGAPAYSRNSTICRRTFISQCPTVNIFVLHPTYTVNISVLHPTYTVLYTYTVYTQEYIHYAVNVQSLFLRSSVKTKARFPSVEFLYQRNYQRIHQRTPVCCNHHFTKPPCFPQQRLLPGS